MRQRGKRKSNKKFRRFMRKYNFVVLALIVFLFLGSCGYLVAKYYAQSAKQGLAVAAGVYFTSNYAVAAEPDSEDYTERIVSRDYQGGEYTIDFQVRNYENNLLFNDKNVTIPYQVSFWLDKAPADAAYTVSDGEQSNEILVGKDNCVTITGKTIIGGSAKADTYAIHIKPAGSEKHQAVPVYVVVQTTEGALIQKTLKGKMQLVNASTPENFIQSSGFVVPAGAGSDIEAVKSEAALTYEIRTVSEGVTASEVTEELLLSWNSSVLDIDRFDSNYVKWITDKKVSEPGNVTGKPGWCYITMHVMPYASEEVLFFGRDNEAYQNINTVNDLNACVTVEKYVTE